MQKLYAYVDETGQDTEGTFYLVSVVIAETERDELIRILETIEQETGKHRRKWNKARPAFRDAYMRRVLHEPIFLSKLHFGIAITAKHYVEATIEITAEAITHYVTDDYRATVLVDGLSRPEERTFAKGLRRHHIHTEKVRGITDEADALIRLADALCGFLREALTEDNAAQRKLMEKAMTDGYLIQVGA